MKLLDKRLLLLLVVAAAVVFYLRRPVAQGENVVLLMNQRVTNDSGMVRVTVAVMSEATKPLSRVSVRCTAIDHAGVELASKTVDVDEKTIDPGYRGDLDVLLNLEGRSLGSVSCKVTEAR